LLTSVQKITRFETTLWVLVELTLLVVPFAIMRPAIDVFRTPKDVVFETLALTIFAAAAAGALLSDRLAAAFVVNRQAAVVAAAAVAWTGIVVTTSLQRDVSYFKPLFVFALAVFFAASMMTARRRGAFALTLVIVPAIANAIVAFLQSTGSARFLITTSAHADKRLWTSGFIGNPNELGGYFVLPLIAAIAASLAWPRLRWGFAAAAAILAGGVIAAQSVTPVIALAAGVAALTLLPGARRLRWVAAAALALLIGGVSLHPGARGRMQSLVTSARSGAVLEMSSYRLPAFVAAWRMFRARPLVGVGPGVFGTQFMAYKLALDADHPSWIRVGNQNFGETHNDHLQLLAETGLPGYLLFLAALALLARLSFARREVITERIRFARTFALPAAAAFAVLALAHFPMQLTSTMVPAVFLAALAFAWMEPDEVA
jgi:O-antigen ligase